MRHFLDVHAAFAGDDHGDFLRRTVGHGRHVIFFLDVRAFFNQEAAHFLAFRAGLVRDELHAQDFAGQLFNLFDAAGEFDAAALAATAGMNLRLDHPHRAAEFLGGFNRLLNGEGRNAARHRHAKIAQDFLALVFVNFHEVASRKQR